MGTPCPGRRPRFGLAPALRSSIVVLFLYLWVGRRGAIVYCFIRRELVGWDARAESAAHVPVCVAVDRTDFCLPGYVFGTLFDFVRWEGGGVREREIQRDE